MKTIRIACGERDWKDKETVFRVLDDELEDHKEAWIAVHQEMVDSEPYEVLLKLACADFILRHGICEGADWLANEWGLARGVTIERFRAEWRDANGYNPAAGPIRNRTMAKAEPKAEQCIAFWSGKMRIKHGKPEYSGTLNMIQAALAEGIPVRIVPPNKEAA